MSEGLYIFTLLLFAGTCVLIFGTRFVLAHQSARTREAREEDYKALSARAVATQTEAASALAALRSEVAGVSARLAAIEGMLRSVE